MLEPRDLSEGAGLEALLDEDPDRREAAIAALPADAATGFALRAVLLFDARAANRARAAGRLGGIRELPEVATWLEDALADPFPSVREAAYAALGRLGDERAIPCLHRGALEEPVWWVRRSAVSSLARVGQHAAVPTLRRVLEDPFWRVRNTALRALRALGASAELDDGTRPGELANAALRWLQGESGGPGLPAELDDGLANPDPAVVTARLERAREVPVPTLIRFLADPHLALRREALRRLLATEELDALEGCLALLADPRRPHAPETTRALLDELDGSIAAELARRALGPRGNAGAAAWAADWIVTRGAEDLYPHLVAELRDSRAPVRRAAARALARLCPSASPPEGALAALELALSDDDDRTRSAAVEALAPLAAEDPGLADRLAQLAPGELSVAARVALASLPALGRSLAADPHPFVRASALEALAAHGELGAELRERALQDPDPWIRAAALDGPGALAVLEDDRLDPQLRRTALERLVGACRGQTSEQLGLDAARIAARARDPWLRARAAALLEPHRGRGLELLLLLSHDRDPIVRSSAADRLERRPELPSELRGLLAAEEQVALAAWSFLLRDPSPELADELEAAIRDCPPERSRLREHLRALTLLLPEELLDARPALAALVPIPSPEPSVTTGSPRRPPREIPRLERRPLGSTGLQVSPLGISGVHNLPVAALREAYEAGVNLFFWEPRHLSLTRFLREQRGERDRIVVVAGSFHGSAAAVRGDVESALRRLRTSHLDLFLLFWVRSAERLSEEIVLELAALKAEGKIRAAGFSTHHRELARAAITSAQGWDAIMIRHSAAHPGAEAELLPTAREHEVGVLGFSALCYGRLLRRVPGAPSDPPSAADCYRYSLSQPGLSACISAPRRQRELEENLEVLGRPTLAPEAIPRLREHGALVHRESARFNLLVRQAGRPSGEPLTAELDELEPLPSSSEEELTSRGSLA